MRKNSLSRSSFFNIRILIFIVLFTSSAVAVLFAVSESGRPNRSKTNQIGISGPMGTSAAQWVWQKPLPQGNPLNAVSFADASNGTAVGEGGTILRTTDGGAHWTIQTSGYEGTGMSLFAVSFTDANTGVAGGWHLSNGSAAVVRTTDGGNTWVTKYTNPGALIFGVSFTDANTGTVIGVDINIGETLILRTTDGGDTWVNQTAPLDFYYGISFTDANNGTIVGAGGLIVRTTDGGNNWTQQKSGTTGDLFGVSFTDPNNGTAVGA